MKFGDYAPPASPSPEQQRDALQKGLGRAVQWALAGRLDDEPLLEACLRDQRFDWQCEGSRTDWLWEMVKMAGAQDRFRVPILHALYKLADEHSAAQLCELAFYYAQAGDETFRSRLYEIVEQKPFPRLSPCAGEEEIIKLDGESAFLFAARERGMLLASREGEWDDGSLTQFAVERFGKERVDQLLEASTDARVRRFRDERRLIEQRQAEPSRYVPLRERMSAISVADILREAEGESECYGFASWGKNAEDAALRIVLQRLWIEQDSKVGGKLLRVFLRRALPDFDARLIELCKRADEEIRWQAFGALGQNTDPLIREFALAELRRGMQDGFAVGLFINNYQRGDEQRILEAMVLPADACQLHWLLMDLIKILEKYPEADCSRLGLIGYASTPCENCPLHFARLLLNQKAAPEWLKNECRYDSDKECRELFGKAAGSADVQDK